MNKIYIFLALFWFTPIAYGQSFKLNVHPDPIIIYEDSLIIAFLDLNLYCDSAIGDTSDINPIAIEEFVNWQKEITRLLILNDTIKIDSVYSISGLRTTLFYTDYEKFENRSDLYIYLDWGLVGIFNKHTQKMIRRIKEKPVYEKNAKYRGIVYWEYFTEKKESLFKIYPARF